LANASRPRYQAVEIVRRIADRHRHDPLAARCYASEFGDAVLNVPDRAHRSERWIDALEALAIHVGVAVDDAGHDGPALEVDHARLGRGVGRQGIVRAHGEDPVAGNSDCLRDGEVVIDGDDLCVAQDQVS
jgi:hypothetical protein